MNGSQSKFVVIGQRDYTDWDEDTQSAVAGVNVTVKAETLPNAFVVFVPRAKFSPENVEILVRHELAQREAVHQLGR